MKAQAAPLVDVFAPARKEFEDLLAWLDEPDALLRSHSLVEETLHTRGLEVLRQAYQGFLRRCSLADRRRAHAQAAPSGALVETVTRPLESLFGRVTLDRCSVASLTTPPRDFPLDRALNLPTELYSLPVRQRVAESARAVAMDPTVASLDRSTGAHVPKRQVEQLVVRAAQDFDAFYAQRAQPANDTLSDTALLVMTSDSKGITMIPEALREATRKKAQQAQTTQPAHGDPMAPKKPRKHDKRMAIVTAVYEQERHVRTAQQVVAGLSRTTEEDRPAPPRPQNKVVTASVEKSQKKGIEAMFDEGERRDPKHQRTAVVLVDGEERQQAKIEQTARSRAWSIVLIVDLLHVLSYVWKATKAVCKHSGESVEPSVTEFLEQLLAGGARKLATRLARLAREHRLSKEERKPVDRCVGYLQKNAKYLRYDEYLAAGYPIATGVIEGACRHLVQDRMGITGARWDLPGAEAVLRLRALQTNGDWEAYWRFHEQQHALRSARKRAA